VEVSKAHPNRKHAIHLVIQRFSRYRTADARARRRPCWMLTIFESDSLEDVEEESGERCEFVVLPAFADFLFWEMQ